MLHLFYKNCYLYFKYYWTIAQIENMRIDYHCFTQQLWNLAHEKNIPVTFTHLAHPLAALNCFKSQGNIRINNPLAWWITKIFKNIPFAAQPHALK